MAIGDSLRPVLISREIGQNSAKPSEAGPLDDHSEDEERDDKPQPKEAAWHDEDDDSIEYETRHSVMLATYRRQGRYRITT
jgi:hypothetical protein